MRGPVILAIDQGTTNTKALLVSPAGEIVCARSQAMQVAHPRPGWAEQSATAIWDAVRALIADLVAAAPEAEIRALALSNQRETILLWDARSGEALAPAVLWQCRRSEQRCAALRDAGHEAEIIARSGLDIDPLFPAAKIGWLLDNVPDGRARAARGELRCGTVDSWLLWKLTDGQVHATDHGNASRTQLLNLDTLQWDPVLAGLFDVPIGLLPQVRGSDSLFGTVAPDVTALPAGTPIRAVMGDSHAALFYHGGSRPGATKVTIGTGSSVMSATPHRVRSTHGLSSTIAWHRQGVAQHALEGNISISGQAAAFIAQLLGLADEAALTELARGVADNGGVVFVPALVGLGAPHWCSEARGSLSGLSLGTRPGHIARATLEAIALQIADVVAAMEADLGAPVPQISVDGGATRNDLLMQLLSDLTGRLILRPHVAEASALGVARLAAEAMGLTVEAGPGRAPDRIMPAMPVEDRQRIKAGWRTAVAGATGRPMELEVVKDGPVGAVVEAG
ncbi:MULTISPECIES: FGGY family carbohydrate kinase [Sphingobium]|uniref:ATP:glycerol 3-phosphotransferase n=1 Tax=Sphingobium yanoikuyae ATCC 51230 TaxID=883163 RepID=K9DA84_SPHYA|nr:MULTISPECIES: FGGY family carbohydrate kinase [Sphingobium]EKU74385.1 glycerol kinase [Sphingobium yanoikuyae ATCC 51230]WQE06317.1 FGGY family carbohydrate kinase [Sphingobium yanoikuyae]SHM48235.1 glycerol kinase [Sphingobium sp. YR657]